jgi:hypothetical protein
VELKKHDHGNIKDREENISAELDFATFWDEFLKGGFLPFNGSGCDLLKQLREGLNEKLYWIKVLSWQSNIKEEGIWGRSIEKIRLLALLTSKDTFCFWVLKHI